MTADQYNPDRAAAQADQQLEQALKRLRDSGVIEFLQSVVEGRKGVEIDVFDQEELPVIMGSSPRVQVRGPITQTEDTVHGTLFTEKKYRTLTVQAPIHDSPIAPLRIDVDTTFITSLGGDSRKTVSRVLVSTDKLHPEMRDQMLTSGLSRIGIPPK